MWAIKINAFKEITHPNGPMHANFLTRQIHLEELLQNSEKSSNIAVVQHLQHWDKMGDDRECDEFTLIAEATGLNGDQLEGLKKGFDGFDKEGTGRISLATMGVSYWIV